MDEQRPFELGSLEIWDRHADLLAAFPWSVLKLALLRCRMPEERSPYTYCRVEFGHRTP